MSTRTGRMSARVAVLVAVVVGCVAGESGAATPRSPAAPATSTAKVTYLAGGSVYVDAGRAEGVAVGDTLDLIQDGSVVGRLRVSVVSTHSASCDTFQVRAPLATGLAVRFVPRVAPPATEAQPGALAMAADSAAAPGTTPATAPRPTSRRKGPPMLRGRVGAAYEVVDGPAGRFERPSLDLRLDGRGVAGAPLDLALDLRSRRSFRRDTTAALSSEFVSRLYRGSMTLHQARARLTIGRQSSPSFSGVSLFDGGLLEWNTARWGLNAFAGTQPEPLKLGFASDIVEAGLYAERRAPAGRDRFWSLGLGAITSQDNGQPNRDFAFAQGFYRAPGTFVTVLQEMDVNRGWRRESASAVSFTSTFASASVTVRPGLALRGGYDGRRSVRLYRDRLTPETEFDDQFRQGAWTGAGWDARRWLRLDGDVRQRFGTVSERSTTWSAGTELHGSGLGRSRLRARYSENRNWMVISRLVSFGLGIAPVAVAHLELSGGTRSDADRLIALTRRTTWASVDADLAVALRWYVLGSYEVDRGDSGDLDQGHMGLSWRF